VETSGGALVNLGPLKRWVGEDRVGHKRNLGEVSKRLPLRELRPAVALQRHPEQTHLEQALARLPDSHQLTSARARRKHPLGIPAHQGRE
jgi:hypothetical protein